MQSQRITFPAALFAMLFSVISAAAPRPTPPPLDLLQDRNVFVGEGEFVSAPAAGRLHFEHVEALRGPVPETVTVVAPYQAADSLSVGQRYIFAYSERARSPSEPRAWVRNPQGPTLLVKTGLEPALLPANDEMRGLLHAAQDRDYIHSARYLRVVMSGLKHADPVMQRLFAAELFGRPALREQLGGRERRALERFVRAPQRDVRAREYLLSAAQLYDPKLGTWWRDAALSVLRAEPVSRAPNAANEVLIWTAFEVVTYEQLNLAPDDATRWVVSGNGAIAEQALLSLRRIAPNQEFVAAQQALLETSLDPGTRVLLTEHVRRLMRGTTPEE